jgi:hypothetical protein
MLTAQDIAVVILNWNGKSLLGQFLPSVKSHSEAAKIYVADNGSTDDSLAFLDQHYPTIKIIKSIKNNGYAKGYNDAIAQVSEPILCLLNSDIEVTKNWLTPILEAFNANSETAIIQPKLLDYKNKAYFEYAGAAGGFIDKYAFPYCRGRIFDSIEQDNGQYDDRVDIFWASGACFFIRNSTFKSLHGFDESFFAHMEEIDLCWRAFNEGYKAKYIGTSTVFHVGGATLENTSPKKTYLNFRNSLSTLVKNTDRNVAGRLFMRMALDGLAAYRFLFLLQPLHFIAILKAHFSFYFKLPYVLTQRKSLKQLPGYHQSNSIVWNYFIKKEKKF